MYEVRYTNRFAKDVRLCIKRGLDISLLENAINILQSQGQLPKEYKPHKLKGNRQRRMGMSYKTRLAAVLEAR